MLRCEQRSGWAGSTRNVEYHFWWKHRLFTIRQWFCLYEKFSANKTLPWNDMLDAILLVDFCLFIWFYFLACFRTLFPNRNQFDIISSIANRLCQIRWKPNFEGWHESHQAMCMCVSQSSTKHNQIISNVSRWMVCFGTWIMYCEIQAPWRIYDNDGTRHCTTSINLKKREMIHLHFLSQRFGYIFKK